MTPVPEWIYVWAWARKCGDTRLFPQQEPFVHANTMTEADYKKVVKAWRKAGSPKTKAHPLKDVDEAA